MMKQQQQQQQQHTRLSPLIVAACLLSGNRVSAFSASQTVAARSPRIANSHIGNARTKPLHMSSSIEPPPGQPQGYSGSGQTSLSQAAVVVSPDLAPAWEQQERHRRPFGSLIRKGRAVLHDLSPAATSEKVPSYKKLLSFASTMGLVFISEPLLGLVDTSVVGWSQGSTGVLQLASMGPATTLIETLLYMTYFLALGTNNLLSQGLAESRWRDLQKTTSHILTVAAGVGLGLTGLLWFGGPALLSAIAGASASPELIAYATSYTRIRALTAPFAVMGLVAQSFCMANHSTKAPLLAVLAASVLNVAGDIMLAKQGVVGAAWATAVATVASFGVLLMAVKSRLKEWRQKELQDWETFSQKPAPLEHTATALDEEALDKAVAAGLPLEEPASVMEMTIVDDDEDDSASPEPITRLEDTMASGTTEEPVLTAAMTTITEEAADPSTRLEVTTETTETAAVPFKKEEETPPRRVPFFSIPDRQSLVSLASVSGPLCFNMWAKMGSYSALTLAATRFGVVPLAAHNILMRLFFFFGCFADSLGMSAQSFLPRTLYPLDKRAYRATLRRLMAISGLGALFLGKAATGILHSAGGYLARDGAMLTAMQTQAPFLAAALFLHPLVVLTEGTVIATRDFGNLIKTYIGTVCVHAFLLANAASFSAVWKALVGFQLVRMGSYRLWRKRGGELETASA